MKVIENVVTIKATTCGLDAKTWRSELLKFDGKPVRITLWENGGLWGEFNEHDVKRAMQYACGRSKKPHVLRALLRGLDTLRD